MGWIDIEKELSEFSSMLISMKQDAKRNILNGSMIVLGKKMKN